MNRIQKTEKSIPSSGSTHPRHPITLDNPKEVMFQRMATVKERIRAFEEKLNADREKNAR